MLYYLSFSTRYIRSANWLQLYPYHSGGIVFFARPTGRSSIFITSGDIVFLCSANWSQLYFYHRWWYRIYQTNWSWLYIRLANWP